jgi:hypothetical protein
VRAKITRRQNSSSGQLEYKLESVAGIAGMRAHIVMGKQKTAAREKKIEVKAGRVIENKHFTDATLNLLLLPRASVCALQRGH